MTVTLKVTVILIICISITIMKIISRVRRDQLKNFKVEKCLCHCEERSPAPMRFRGALCDEAISSIDMQPHIAEDCFAHPLFKARGSQRHIDYFS